MGNGADNIIDIAGIAAGYFVLVMCAYFFGGYEIDYMTPIITFKKFGANYKTWPLWLQAGSIGSLTITGIIIMLNPLREKSNLYGGAHWATEKEIKNMGLRQKSGVILGKKSGKFLRTNEPLSMLVYAPPGSGKTAGIIIPSLISCANSAIVHDPKGELYEKTGPRRASFSKIIKFAPGETESAKWNPFSKKELPEQWDNIQVHVDRLSQSLFAPESKAKGSDYWLTEARSIFMFWTLFLIRKNGETNFPEIIETALSSGDPQEAIAEAIDESEDLPTRIITEGNGLLAKADKEFAGVLGTFKSNMNVFLDPKVAKNVSGCDFSLWDLRKEKTTIYLCVKNTDQTRLKKLLSLFFEVATLTMLDHEPTENEQRVTLFLDEFVRLARMQEVLEMPAIGRSYKLNAIYVCQSYSQLVDIYGQSGADQLKNTCSYHVFFAQNERKIAEDISSSIGKYTRKKGSISKSSKNPWGKNTSTSDEGVPLILPQEILSLKFGRVLICQQNNFETPIDAKVCWWFKDKAMKKLVE